MSNYYEDYDGRNSHVQPSLLSFGDTTPNSIKIQIGGTKISKTFVSEASGSSSGSGNEAYTATHKVVEMGKATNVSLSCEGGCWNSNSIVIFSSSGAKLYFGSPDNENSCTKVIAGQEYPFAEDMALFLVADAPIDSSNTVSVSAVAYPKHASDTGGSTSSNSGNTCPECHNSPYGTVKK